MPVQISIIGLGQVGSSIGLALKSRAANVHIVGHDKDTRAAKLAQDAGAVHAYKHNLPESVREARVVIIALPLDGMKQTLEVIGPDLQEGTLVLDTAPAKGTVASWAKEFIPQGRHYVGLFPSIHPVHLHGIEYGVESARADLFEKGVMAVVAPHGTPENVFKLTTDFVSLLGSTPLLMDTVEADGLISKVQILPQLAAAALLDATIDQPGWQEARKLAGRPYATVTSGLAYYDDAASLCDASLEDRESTVRLLNSYITSLLKFRDEIEDGNHDALEKLLEVAWSGRTRWFDERLRADWVGESQQKVDAPSFGESMNQILFGSAVTGRNKKRK
jgi:prephenate dehydrogenase